MAVTIFRIKASEIVGKRWTPNIYLDHKFNYKYELILFNQIIESISGGATPHLSRKGNDLPYTDNSTQGIPFLRIQNITEQGLVLEDVKYITKQVHSTELYRSQLYSGDIVFTITGRLGTASIIPEGFIGNINQHSVRIRLNTNKVLTKYITIYFNSEKGQKEVWRLASGGTRPALDYVSVRNLQIPLPPMDTQEEIANLMDHAYSEKKRLESEADELLKSINPYIMDKLGVVQNQETKPTEKWFTVKASEIRGKRWDSSYYCNETSESVKYSMCLLKECSLNNGIYGANETAIDIKEDNYTRYIRITDIDQFGQLKSKGQKTANHIEDRYILKEDDFLFARTGSVGRTFLYKNKYGKSIFAGYLIKFQLNKEKIYPEYLFYYTQTNHYWNWVNKHQRPAVQSNINAEEYRSLQIPLPPMEIQKEVAHECETRRSEALTKKELAKSILDNAKAKVENMLFEE